MNLSTIVRTSDGAIATIPLSASELRLDAQLGAHYTLTADCFSVDATNLTVLRIGNDLMVNGLPNTGGVSIAGFFLNTAPGQSNTLVLDRLTGETDVITPLNEPIGALRDGGFLMFSTAADPTPPVAPGALSQSAGQSPLLYAGAGIALLTVSVAGSSSDSPPVGSDPADPPSPTPAPAPAPEPTPAPAPEPTPAPAPTHTVSIDSVLDNEDPVTDSYGSGAIINDDEPELAGQFDRELLNGQVVIVERNGNAIGTAEVTGTQWTFEDTLRNDDAYTYQVFVVDQNDEILAASALFDLTLDTEEPNRPIIDNIAGNNRISASEFASGLQLTGEAEAGSTVTLDWGDLLRSTSVAADGRWAFDIDVMPVGRGRSTVSVIATDDAGNVSDSRDQAVRVDFRPTVVGSTLDTASSATLDPFDPTQLLL